MMLTANAATTQAQETQVIVTQQAITTSTPQAHLAVMAIETTQGLRTQAVATAVARVYLNGLTLLVRLVGTSSG